MICIWKTLQGAMGIRTEESYLKSTGCNPHNAILCKYRQNMDQPSSIHEDSASLPDVSLEDFDDGWPGYEEPVIIYH